MSKLSFTSPPSEQPQPNYVNFEELENGEIFMCIKPELHARFLIKVYGEQAVDLLDGNLIEDHELSDTVVHRVDAEINIIKIHR